MPDTKKTDGGIGQIEPLDQMMEDLKERIEDAMHPVAPTRGQEGLTVEEMVPIAREWLEEVLVDLTDSIDPDVAKKIADCEAENRRLHRRVERLKAKAAGVRGLEDELAALKESFSGAVSTLHVMHTTLGDVLDGLQESGQGGGRD